MTEVPEYERQWHLDKRVPIALILTIVGQTFTAIWWLASLSQRVDVLERNASAAIPRLESVIRLETQVAEIHNAVQEIKALVNRPQR
jgi:hypothetical protein